MADETEFLADIFLNSPIGIFIIQDGKFRFVNPAFERISGFTEAELFEMHPFRIVLPEDLDKVRENAVRMLKGESSSPHVYRAVDKGGEIRWIIETVTSIRYGGRRATLGYFMDNTEHEKAKRALQERTADLVESEEKYRTLVENVPLVVYRMRSTGEILFVNHFVEEAFGYTPAEIFRNPALWNEKVYHEDRAKVEAFRAKSFSEGEEFVAEYRVKHKNGRIVYVVDHAIPSESAGGLVGSIDGIIMDVTGRVKLQAELVRSEGVKAISEVSARLAHEIRNPLVSAGGFARRLLASMRRDDPNRAKVEIIVKEVGRLETILRMILTYLRPMELDKSPTQVNRLVERALRAVDPEIEEKDVRTELRLSNGLPEVTVDREQMELVVEALTKNALNQIAEGEVLAISTCEEDDTVSLVIRYPGEDLSYDDVEHFFHPFTTYRELYDAADLPMSKIVVEKHGGSIDVDLSDSHELTIHLSLPI
jgi:PAS domain S-box-containing protein